MALLPFADPEADRLLARLPAERRRTSWHVVRTDGDVRSAAAAGAELLRVLGCTRTARLAVRAERLTDRLYAVVASQRGRLGRLLPDGPAPRRFP